MLFNFCHDIFVKNYRFQKNSCAIRFKYEKVTANTAKIDDLNHLLRQAFMISGLRFSLIKIRVW